MRKLALSFVLAGVLLQAAPRKHPDLLYRATKGTVKLVIKIARVFI